MSANQKTPPCRSLDIYRLVVVRHRQQLEVARSFGVTPPRISQVVRRVRAWVNQAIGDWLFPGRDDLRFYVALQCEQIRVHELPSEPETVLLVGPGWTYARQHGVVSGPDADEGAALGAQATANISAQPINSAASASAASVGAKSCGATESLPPGIDEVSRKVAEMLMLWKKTRKLSAAFKTPSL